MNPKDTKPGTKPELGARFKQYLPLAYKLAGKLAARYGIPYSTMTDEAESVLAWVVAQWDTPGAYKYKGTCSHLTWVYRAVYWDLVTFATRKQDRAIPFSRLGGAEQKPVDLPARESWVRRLLTTLGDDARTVVRVILYAPAEIVEEVAPHAPARSRRAVQRYLAGQGWDGDRVAAAWAEVEVAL